MTLARRRITAALVAVLALAIGPSQFAAADQNPQPPAAQNSPAAAELHAATPAPAPSISATKKPTLRQRVKRRVKALVAKFTPSRMQMDRDFKTAAALFPGFCKHWQQDLEDRERDNRYHLTFQDKNGNKFATYTGYGKIETCEAHQSPDGFAIGKLSYKEFVYSLTGRTESEARAATPTPITTMPTIEIFRWDKNKWFY
jgi:hypothetical protein